MSRNKPFESLGDGADKAGEYFVVYDHHSKLLRTWLIAYGIGAPVLFLTNESLWKVVAESDRGFAVGPLFVAGVAFQVFVTLMNKAIMWCLYFGETDPEFKKGWRYKVAEFLADQFWIDIVADAASVVLFAIGTWQLFSVLGAA